MASPSNMPERGHNIDALRIVFWLIQAVWLTAALSLGMFKAQRDHPYEPVAQQHDAAVGQVVVGSAADAGHLLGATEAEPLGRLPLDIEAVANQQIKDNPPVEQPRL